MSAVVLAAAVLGGCGAPTAPVVQPTPRPPLPAPTDIGAPTTAAAEPGVDVIATAIRSAPPVCGAPEHQLVGYRGRVDTTRTVLQVTEGHRANRGPVAPVEVDLTGDGGLDLVGVVSCTVAGQDRSDNIVLYTGPATPAASLDLGAQQEGVVAVVRSLSTIGGEVRLEWTAMAAGQAAGQYEATVTWNGREIVLEDVGESSGPRTITTENASFMSPDGNVHCVLHGALGWCDVSETTWTPPSPPPPTPVARDDAPADDATGDEGDDGDEGVGLVEEPCEGRAYGRTFLLNGGRASQTCRGEQGPQTAALGAPLAVWHRGGWDPVVVVDGRRSAAVAAGSTIRTGAISCEAAASEITCTDTRTQASFTVGRSTARVSSS